MKVLADVTCLRTGSTGVARYASSLLDALEGEGVEVRRFAIGGGSQPLPTRTRHSRLPLRVAHAAWRFSNQPRAERFGGSADLLHTLDLVPAPTRLPSVVTMHDLAAIEYPAEHPRRAVAMQTRQLAAARVAHAVIAVSQVVGTALVERGVPAGNVFVVPHGVGLPAPAGVPAADGRFFLVVGGLHPRKGLDVVIRALAHLPEDVRVVHAGPSGAAAEELAATASELGVAGRIAHLGPVSDAQLARLYADCVALVFPSIAEGFGLPVLECLSVGSPVIASDLPVLHEVGGEVACYAAAGDVDGWRAAMVAVLTDDAVTQGARRDGPPRAHAFTWRASALRTMAAYRHALVGARRA